MKHPRNREVVQADYHLSPLVHTFCLSEKALLEGKPFGATATLPARWGTPARKQFKHTYKTKDDRQAYIPYPKGIGVLHPIR